mmetsp:Transcript_29966/g.69712  ORF Transcript_29966/g.69712 Transcript_29966/m.69712 type:complete len:222 (+) Transcript_29966:234-899(+)
MPQQSNMTSLAPRWAPRVANQPVLLSAFCFGAALAIPEQKNRMVDGCIPRATVEDTAAVHAPAARINRCYNWSAAGQDLYHRCHLVFHQLHKALNSGVVRCCVLDRSAARFHTFLVALVLIRQVEFVLRRVQEAELCRRTFTPTIAAAMLWVWYTVDELLIGQPANSMPCNLGVHLHCTNCRHRPARSTLSLLSQVASGFDCSLAPIDRVRFELVSQLQEG